MSTKQTNLQCNNTGKTPQQPPQQQPQPRIIMHRHASVMTRRNKQLKVYKTEMCTKFDKPVGCSHGDNCQYAHGIGDLRVRETKLGYKTRVCSRFQKGGCPYGDRCQFVHGDEREEEILNQRIFVKRSLSEKRMAKPLRVPSFEQTVAASIAFLLDESTESIVQCLRCG